MWWQQLSGNCGVAGPSPEGHNTSRLCALLVCWPRTSTLLVQSISLCTQLACSVAHLLPELLLECPLVAVELGLPLGKLVLLQLQGQLRVCLECGDVVLLLIQQVLDLLLVDLQARVHVHNSRRQQESAH